MNSTTHTTDVFIVGGGPAGLATAIAARQRGLRVTVADGTVAPIDKPCGEGIMPQTLAALRELGVAIGPRDGMPFRGIRFVQDRLRFAAEFPQGPGIGLRRVALHEALIARAEECGVSLLWQSPVTRIASDGVECAGQKISARWIVGADGQHSRVRQWCGIDRKYFQQRYASRRHFAMKPWSEYVEVHWGQRAQAYVTPVGEDETCVVMLSANVHDADFDRALAEFPEIRERLSGAALTSRERGTVTSMCTLRAVHRGNVALVGDASGGVDAITGEGIGLGLHHATILADAMCDGTLNRYERLHRNLALRPFRMGQLLLLLDRSPALRRRVFRALEARPALFASTLAMHLGLSRPTDYVTTGAQLGWRLLFA